MAQAIAPAVDGTGTTITQLGNEYLIEGGTQSGNNLFHSFEQFGLDSGQVANFVGNPALANILGRVTGGDVSLINGLLQVSNSDANLYLMNPAGFVFGADAQLDLTGSFAATTANRIGIGEDFFNGFGANNYAALSGSPNSFVFDFETGMILNQGELTVADTESLWLVGSAVLNLGTMSGGNISLTAMPEQRQIKISQPGSLLSLALDAAPLGADGMPTEINLFTVTDLPKYLTGGYGDKIEVADDGQVSLKQGDTLIPFNAGDVAIAGSVTAENIQLMAAGKVTPTDPGLVQGDVTVVRYPEAGGANILSIIDSNADNPQALLYGGTAGTIATIVNNNEDGIGVITETLAKINTLLDGMTITAEGNEGNFWLGNTWITPETIKGYQGQLAKWSVSFTDAADLLLYSCFTALGSTGEALMASLAMGTGLDVAASTNATGSANYGGDWTLESRTGSIEIGNPFEVDTLSIWDGKLATRTVTDFSDAGNNTLRNEISLATAGDTVKFVSAGTVTLGGTEIAWATNNLTIDGNGGTVSGNNASRVFNVTANVPTTFANLTITGGNTIGNGGGINSSGAVTLTNSTVSGHYSASYGGGIFSDGDVTLTNSTVSDTTTVFDGGGIFSNGAVTLTNSTVSDNSTGNSAAGFSAVVV